MRKVLNRLLLTGLIVGMTTSWAVAAGTTAGTPINNTATVNYTVDGIGLSKDSPTVSFTVAELLDVTLVSRDATNIIVKPGETGSMLTFELTNTGNYDEDFGLTFNNTVAGNDFDPLAPTQIYFDANDNDTYDAGIDTLYDGSNLPTLAGDESIHLFLFNDIPDVGPGDPADGDLGSSELTATAQTKSAAGDPEGTAYAGAGFDGSVAAVVGTSLAVATDSGTYQVSRVDVSIDKNGVVVEDGLAGAGTEPVPGATIEYTIDINVTGGTAVGLVISDPIPGETTYVSGSLTLDGGPLTEGSGDDEGEVVENPVGSGNFEVNVDLGDVVGGAAPGTDHQIIFQVTIK